MKVCNLRRGVKVHFPARLALLVSGFLCISAPVVAQTAAPAPEPMKETETSFWKRDTLTGDWSGRRAELKDKYGIEITLDYIGEALAVLSGGLHRRTSYEGRLEFTVDTDLQKLMGWNGGSTHVTIFNIHDGGHNAADNVGSIADPSNIDALATTRLFTAWFQQNLFDDRLSVRLGQLAADDEFIASPTAGGLLNGTFGWTGMLASNLTNGGPAYPLAAPGARVSVKPTEHLTLQAAVFSGDPAGHNCDGNPQACNKHGATFSFSGGALWMSELQFAINQDKKAEGLPGVYKVGAWYATADFADKHFGVNGADSVVSLADPSAVASLDHSGNRGFYGVVDQALWRSGERSLRLFMRTGVAPSDRNLVSFHIDGGVGIKGLLPSRADDVLTFGMAYRRISRDAAALDRDMLATNGLPYPIRNSESQIELNYLAQIAPWWTVQPDMQYIAHPGGNVADPADRDLTVRNALVVGVRTTIKF